MECLVIRRNSNNFRVLVCGDRNWSDEYIVIQTLSGLLHEQIVSYGKLIIIEGCAPGADNVACHFLDGCSVHASHDEVKHRHFPANWDRYGRSAGPRRNIQMLEKGKPDVVYAFHDNLAKSKGTKHMVKIAKEAGVPVYLVSHG